jgi:hypothetical protein
MVLSFQAYGQALDGSLPVGARVHADLHRYPGAVRLRALVGRVHEPPKPHPDGPPAIGLAEACDHLGAALAREPWLERMPVTVRATPVPDRDGWALADVSGALAIAGTPAGLPALVACSAGRPVAVTAEWTAEGLVPLSVHGVAGAGGTVDIGPREGW